ncbi:hypothetical protein Lser_V15G36969 [Lactuca serriola]
MDLDTNPTMIPDDDVQQSEGINSATEQLVISDFSSIPSPTIPFVPSKLSPAKGFGPHGPVSVSKDGGPGDGAFGSTVFVPSWDLRNNSRLSVSANSLEFSRHAFPPAAVEDMEAMGNPALTHNMAYAAAQAMFYLVVGSRRIHTLGKVESTHATCGSRVASLEHRLSKLGDDLRSSEKKCELLASEKNILDEVRAALETKVDSLTQMNEGLMIQVESLERATVDRDKLLSSLQSEVDAARRDLDWLLHIGVVRIVEKLIEHLDFTNAISLIRHVAYMAGVDSIQMTLGGSGSGEAVVGALSVGPVVSINDALLSFASMDHASLLGLGEVGIEGLRELCSFGGSEGMPESIVGHEMVLVTGADMEGDGKDHGSGGGGERDFGASVGDGNVSKVVVDDIEGDGGVVGENAGKSVREEVVAGEKDVRGDGLES